jgi:hypothetical protein
VDVVWGENTQEFWSHAIEAYDAPGLRLENFNGLAGKPGLDAQKID